MAKTTVDRQVEQALQTLIAPREDSVRSLAEALEEVTRIEARLSNLEAERERALDVARVAARAAKDAGWKPRELEAAGLVVPAKPARRKTAPTQTTHPGR